MKKCSECKLDKDEKEFTKCKRRIDGLQGICKECSKAYMKTYYKENLEKAKAQGKAWYKANLETAREMIKAWHKANPDKLKANSLKRKYGLTLEEFKNLLKKQENKCAICGRSGKLVVDHDHRTGKIRDLLCNNCNRGIGYLKDSSGVLLKAAQYLKSWEEKA